MGIWTYKRDDFDEQDLKKFLSLDFCPYCYDKIELLFQDNTEKQGSHLIHRESINVHICPACGWWRAKRDLWVFGPTIVESPNGPTKVEMPKSVINKNAAVGSLRALDLSDISIPVNEIRAYLTARFDSRFSINPRLFEETVASVFKSYDYDVKITGFSNDGGIDIILHNESGEIGVQVKRYKNSIEVEQIRSLAGALLLRGITKGIFVTTSNFQRGTHDAIKKFEKHGYKIELMNAEYFYSALKIAQRQIYSSKKEFLEEHDLSHMRLLEGFDVI